MLGLIKDENLDEAESEFPGIRALYLGCGEKPRTFLELLARYLAVDARMVCSTIPPGSISIREVTSQ